ncbi:hypothetical protein Leryth_009182 [Lithospermum erythrorhizon]|nr:hypothetical protein Leryth_009182 [Lithospermum erythrorhizon]
MNRIFSHRSLQSSLQTINNYSCYKIIIKNVQLCTATDVYRHDYVCTLPNDQTSIANVLNISGNSKSIDLGTQIHCQVIKLGLSNEVFSGNNLIKMYSKCGDLCNALKVFDEMPVRNIVSWTLIVSLAAQNGELEVGFQAFLEIMRNGLMPNQFTFGSVLKICMSCSNSSYTCGMSLCVQCISWKIGLNDNPFVVSSLLHMYAKDVNIEAAEKIFEESVQGSGDDVGCWNAMIGAYAQCGFGFEAVKVASLMHCQGLRMDECTFINALSGCSVSGDLEHGKQIHSLILMHGMIQKISVVNSLMDMYFKGGKRDSGLKLFKSIKEKDIVSWNTIFSGFSLDPDAGEIVNFFRHFMLSGLKANAITFSTLVRSCGEVRDWLLGLQFYCLAIQSGFIWDTLVVSSLISMFCKCDSIDMVHSVYDPAPCKNTDDGSDIVSSYSELNLNIETLRVFQDLLARGIEVSEITISYILEACLDNKNVETAKQIHGVVIKWGYAYNVNVSGSLVKVYIRYGLLDESYKFFHNPRKTSLVSWSVMVSALVHQGCNSEAIGFLKRMMMDGERPDGFILSSVLAGCAALASHCLAMSLHSLAMKMGFELYAPVASALIDAYSKCGDLRSAKTAFYISSSSADVVVFNTMIMAYAHHGLPLEAMQVFQRIKEADMKPSQATFITVMSACRHAGLVELDLLSRNGFLDNAKKVILQMPYAPWPAIWRSFLHGCIIHGNRELAAWASREAFQFFQNDGNGFILYSKIFSEHDNWEDEAKLRNKTFDGVPKVAAYSLIEVY